MNRHHCSSMRLFDNGPFPVRGNCATLFYIKQIPEWQSELATRRHKELEFPSACFKISSLRTGVKSSSA